MQGFFKEFTMRTDENEYAIAEKYAIAHGLDLEGAVILFIRDLAQGNVPTYIKNSHSKAPDDFISWLIREEKLYGARYNALEMDSSLTTEDAERFEGKIRELYNRYSQTTTAPDDYTKALGDLVTFSQAIPKSFFDDRE